MSLLNPHTYLRLKQILTVNNPLSSLRHTLLNQSYTTFAGPDFDRSDFSSEIGTNNIDKITLWPLVDCIRRKSQSLFSGIEEKAHIDKFSRPQIELLVLENRL